jgi:flagellin
MRQLVVQGGNRTLSLEDRDALGQEFNKLLSVNDDISERTAFGTMNILNYESNVAGFQIQSGAQSGEQDTVTTGNAKLTAMFGSIMKEDGLTGDLSDMDNSTLSLYGVMGEIVAAYVATGNATTVSVAISNIFGQSFQGGTTVSVASDMMTNSVTQINASALTQILTKEGAVSIFAGTASLLETVALIADNVANAFVATSNVSDEQQNDLLAFVTDALLDTMSDLVTDVDRMRARLGAEQNGLSSTIRSNTTAIVNVSDARSRITDTDFAAETAELTRNQIIQQASTSILAQANQLPQAALSLLG